MTEAPANRPITQTNINIAREAVRPLRNEEYTSLRQPVQIAIDDIMGELSACADTDSLMKRVAEKTKFIKEQFVKEYESVTGKFKALDMVKVYADSICKQLDVKMPKEIDFF